MRKILENTRPTAQTLYGIRTVLRAIEAQGQPAAARKRIASAMEVADDAECCRQIGVHGGAILKTATSVSTRSTGWLRS